MRSMVGHLGAATLVVCCWVLAGSSTLAQPPAGAVTINGVEFVPVPAGPFAMGTPLEQCVSAYETQEPDQKVARAKGRDYCATHEGPQHQVALKAFYIMRTEVTIAQYDRLVQATGARRPDDRRPRAGAGIPRGSETETDVPFTSDRRGPSEPVTDVTWHEARAFCEWLGRGTGSTTRLPTEAEWEKAARGTDGRVYPWSDAFDGRRLNFADGNSAEPWRDASANDGFADVAPVGSFPPGASPYGALDMAGNVSEWVSSLLWPYPYVATDGRERVGETICTEANLRGCRLYRGGSYRHSAVRTRSASRVSAAYLSPRFIDVGFRCVAQASSQR